jgi:hypothetical protein
MGIASKDEARALSRAVGNAALSNLKAMTAGDLEAVRAAFWNRTPEPIRMMACHMAGIDAKRGKAALNTFDAADRARLHAQLRHLIPHLENLMRCATGGKTHDHGEMAPHSYDGIAAPEAMQ